MRSTSRPAAGTANLRERDYLMTKAAALAPAR